MFSKISGSKRNLFLKVSLNFENVLISEVHKYKGRFSESWITQNRLLHIFAHGYYYSFIT